MIYIFHFKVETPEESEMQAAMAEGAFWMNTSTQTTNPLKKRRLDWSNGMTPRIGFQKWDDFNRFEWEKVVKIW